MTPSGQRLCPGGDPRALPDYVALRDEMSKLTHPARPDVDWLRVETLCFSLFRLNGADLQTAAWYALARTQRGGLAGMNEGLALLSALAGRDWAALWPPQAYARTTILAALGRRLQRHLRTLTPAYTDLPALYQADGHLGALGEVLRRLELQHQAGLLPLQQQVQVAAARLEASADRPACREDDEALTAEAEPGTPDAPSPCRLYVLPPPPARAEPPRLSRPPAVPVWKPFVAGVLATAATLLLTLWAMHRLTDRPEAALMATLSPLPSPLTESSLQALRQQGFPDKRLRATWSARAQAQLEQLAALPPAWPLTYGSGLVRQAQALWPDASETAALSRRWQQSLNAVALPAESLTGWQQGMTRLQALTDRLNGLDPKKGEYMTVSELKSQVFAITQAFGRTVPAEEALRRLMPGAAPSASDAVALRAQAEHHLAQLQARYVLLTQSAGALPDTPALPQTVRPSGGEDGL